VNGAQSVHVECRIAKVVGVAGGQIVWARSMSAISFAFLDISRVVTVQIVKHSLDTAGIVVMDAHRGCHEIVAAHREFQVVVEFEVLVLRAARIPQAVIGAVVSHEFSSSCAWTDGAVIAMAACNATTANDASGAEWILRNHTESSTAREAPKTLEPPAKVTIVVLACSVAAVIAIATEDVACTIATTAKIWFPVATNAIAHSQQRR